MPEIRRICLNEGDRVEHARSKLLMVAGTVKYVSEVGVIVLWDDGSTGKMLWNDPIANPKDLMKLKK